MAYGRIDMPERGVHDTEHATRIKHLAASLTKAINDAANAGLDVDVDAQTTMHRSLNGSRAVPIWTITTKIARPL